MRKWNKWNVYGSFVGIIFGALGNIFSIMSFMKWGNENISFAIFLNFMIIGLLITMWLNKKWRNDQNAY